MGSNAVLSILLALSFLGPAQLAWGRTYGPLPYQDISDSPFDLAQLGTSFFVEDFEHGVDYATRHLDALDFDYQIVKLKTPGAYSGGHYTTQRSGRGGLAGDFVCTNSFPSSCHSALELTFDQDELGFLPQAVGIVVDTSGFTVSLSAIDAQNQIIDSVTAHGLPMLGFPNQDNAFQWPAEGDPEQPGQLPPDFSLPDPVPQGYTFLGVTHPEGISRIAVSSSLSFIVDEIQYGLLVPEPSTLSLVLVAAYGPTIICRALRRPRRYCA
jgi:hypothetical protein